MERVKICPQCKAEYYPDILDCADCGVALVWPEARPSLAPQRAAELARLEEDKWWGVEKKPRNQHRGDGWEYFAEEEILGHLTSDIERIIASYRTRLVKLGVPTAILPTTRFQPAIDRLEQSVVYGNRHLVQEARQVPVGDVLGGFQYDLFVRREDVDRAEEVIAAMFGDLHPGLEKGFYSEYEMGQCPACGAELSENAEACPDCGLPFTAQEE